MEIIQEPDSDKFESFFEKLKKEKEKKEVFYLFMKTFDKIQEVRKYFFMLDIVQRRIKQK